MSDEGFAIVDPDEVENPYADSDVPGEFRRLTEQLGCEQLAATLIRVPPHSDFEQGTGHFHEKIEELYLLSRGTLTMRFGEEIRTVSAPAAVRVSANATRSHRNEGSEPVEMWAVSRQIDESDATKIDEFWDASPQAVQRRG
jgi:mannose-6-phosphate isomerase-like protein (cupin superfamily)